MSKPAIKAALTAAHREASSFYTEADTARIVAAFLRALPDLTVCGRNVCYLQDIAMSPKQLVEAVERAAREAADA